MPILVFTMLLRICLLKSLLCHLKQFHYIGFYVSNNLWVYPQAHGLPWCSDGKEPTCNVGDLGSIEPPRFNLWVGKIPWRKTWQLTPVFLPGDSQWTEEPGWLQSMGLQRVLHKWATEHFKLIVREKKCIPSNLFLLFLLSCIEEQITHVVTVKKNTKM